ncbi:MAG: acetate--CoA ligase family protein [Bacillota bacterium]
MFSLKEKLDAVFYPRSVVVIGASGDFSKVSGRPLKFLLNQGYKGNLYAINPRYKDINGIKCYPDLTSLPEVPDLAVIILPAPAVTRVIEEAAGFGLKAALIITSGFAEMGGEGRKLQEKIKEIARTTGIAVCGPNSAGIINASNGMAATISQVIEKKVFKSGNAAFITQSGAFGTFITALAQDMNIGFKYYVSTGNEVDVEMSDYIEYILEDPEIRVVAAYIEGLRNGKKFARIAERAAELGKAIVAIKVGRTERGAKAAQSHTASITGVDEIYDGIFKQKGVIRAEDERDLLDIISVFQNEPWPAGNGVGIITMSGGAGVLLTDSCYRNGLEVPELQPETIAELKGKLPPFSALENPVDITGQFLSDPDLLKYCILAMDRDKGIHSIVLFMGLILEKGKQVSQDITKLVKQISKPLYVVWIAGPEDAIADLRKSGVTVFTSPVSCVKAIATLFSHQQFVQETKEDKGKELLLASKKEECCREAKSNLLQKQGFLTEYAGKKILASYGISVPKGELAKSLTEALSVAREIGYPVCLKVQSPDIMHKTEAGVVRLNISDDDQLTKAYDDVIRNAVKYKPSAVIEGVIVEKMAEKGYEIIIGVLNDQDFGPVLMYGMGGIFIEVIKDVSYMLAPLTYRDAEKMISSTKAVKILKGARGGFVGDVDAIIDVLLKVSKLAYDFKDSLEEIDINPILVHEKGKGVTAVDCLFKLKVNS